MTLSKNEAHYIVKNYILLINDFLEKKSNNFQNYAEFNIIQIMYLIGKFNFIEELNIIIQNTYIKKYFEYLNIFYYTMISCIHHNNYNMMDILKETIFMDIDEYTIIYKNLIKKHNKELIELNEL